MWFAFNASVIARTADILCHFHASEPYLGGFEAPEGHAAAARELLRRGYSGWVALEMRAADPPLPALKKAIAFVRGTYGRIAA